LKRGGIYTWTIRAVNKEGDASSVVSQGKFRVLSQDKVRELNQLKTSSQSHFAIGLFYAREGMVADAEREFRVLLKANPNSPVLKKLIKDVGSWQKR
jgi:predicted Zn-dependent protease